MAWQKGAKKEIAEGWKWMRHQNPNAAKDAEAWVKENKEDMKEVDRILYRSDEHYYGKTSKLHAEDAHSIASDKKHIDTDAYLTQAERDRIYDDHAYIPNEFYREGTDDDDMVRLPNELAKGVDKLTDLQREVIFPLGRSAYGNGCAFACAGFRRAVDAHSGVYHVPHCDCNCWTCSHPKAVAFHAYPQDAGIIQKEKMTTKHQSRRPSQRRD